MKRRAFSLVELMLVLAVLALLAAFALPHYRNFLIRSDLERATQQMTQVLRSAQIRSQHGEQDSAWGVYTLQGILFKGESFANRDTGFDEVYPLPNSVTVSGITEVWFSRLYGIPSVTGTIILTAINGDVREIPVTADQLLSGPAPPDLAGDVRIKVDFLRIRNHGDGSAENAVYVGQDALRYEDGSFIPLKTDGVTHIDASLSMDVTGMAMQRLNGTVRIMNFGGLSPGGKEVVDALITIDNADIENVENDLGENETENPFDGNENTGVGGDEVTADLEEGTVLFQTRVTNAGDSILIHWKQDPMQMLR